MRFQRHNLVDPPPQAPRGAWDVIVCHNVLIYDGAPSGPGRPAHPPNLRLAPQDIPPIRDPADKPAPDASSDLVSVLHRGPGATHEYFEALKNDIAAAIEVYDAIVRVHPSVAERWLFLGIARYAHGGFEEAASALRASLCLDTTQWLAGFYLAGPTSGSAGAPMRCSSTT